MVDSERSAAVLLNAVQRGDIVAVRRMVENGYDPKGTDYDKRSALHLAAAEGFLSICEFLIDKGADVNCEDRWKGTPLTDAIKHEHTGMFFVFVLFCVVFVLCLCCVCVVFVLCLCCVCVVFVLCLCCVCVFPPYCVYFILFLTKIARCPSFLEI